MPEQLTGRERIERTDLGLELAMICMPPHYPMTLKEIGAWTGTTTRGAHMMFAQAFRHMVRAMSRHPDPVIRAAAMRITQRDCVNAVRSNQYPRKSA